MIGDYSAVLLLVAVILFFKLAQAYVFKRKLYKEIENLDGPKSLPFLGDVYVFSSVNNTKDALEVFMKTVNSYKMPMKLKILDKLCYITIDPEELKIILNHPQALRKGILYDQLEAAVPNTLLLADVPKWRKMRKALSPFFTKTSTDSFHTAIVNQAELLVYELQQLVDKGYIDVSKKLKTHLLESVCENLFGVGIDLKNYKIDLVDERERFFEFLFLKTSRIPYRFRWLYKMTNVHKEEIRLQKLCYDFALEVLKMKESERVDDKSKDKKKRSLLEILIKLKEKKQLTEYEICMEIILFLAAGSDTTTASLGFALLCLGMHQDVQERVYREVSEVVGLDRNVQLEDIPKLQYTTMFIKEVLRLFPAPGIMSRELTDDINIGSRILPSGIVCLIPVLHIQRHPKFWKNPLKFDPDRFLPEEIEKRHPYTLLSFSAGARNCIGYRYAMLTLQTTIAAIVQKLKIKCKYKSIEEIELHPKPTLSSNYVCSFENRN